MKSYLCVTSHCDADAALSQSCFVSIDVFDRCWVCWEVDERHNMPEAIAEMRIKMTSLGISAKAHLTTVACKT